VPGRLFALPDTARARVTSVGVQDGFEVATGEHFGYGRIGVAIHRRKVWLRQDAAVLADELSGDGDHAFVSRLYVPHTQLNTRLATEAEVARFEELQGAGFAFGLDTTRCVSVRDSSGA